MHGIEEKFQRSVNRIQRMAFDEFQVDLELVDFFQVTSFFLVRVETNKVGCSGVPVEWSCGLMEPFFDFLKAWIRLQI